MKLHADSQKPLAVLITSVAALILLQVFQADEPRSTNKSALFNHETIVSAFKLDYDMSFGFPGFGQLEQMSSAQTIPSSALPMLVSLLKKASPNVSHKNHPIAESSTLWRFHTTGGVYYVTFEALYSRDPSSGPWVIVSDLNLRAAVLIDSDEYEVAGDEARQLIALLKSAAGNPK